MTGIRSPYAFASPNTSHNSLLHQFLSNPRTSGNDTSRVHLHLDAKIKLPRASTAESVSLSSPPVCDRDREGPERDQ